MKYTITTSVGFGRTAAHIVDRHAPAGQPSIVRSFIIGENSVQAESDWARVARECRDLNADYMAETRARLKAVNAYIESTRPAVAPVSRWRVALEMLAAGAIGAVLLLILAGGIL